MWKEPITVSIDGLQQVRDAGQCYSACQACSGPTLNTQNSTSEKQHLDFYQILLEIQ